MASHRSHAGVRGDPDMGPASPAIVKTAIKQGGLRFRLLENGARGELDMGPAVAAGNNCQNFPQKGGPRFKQGGFLVS